MQPGQELALGRIDAAFTLYRLEADHRDTIGVLCEELLDALQVSVGRAHHVHVGEALNVVAWRRQKSFAVLGVGR